MNLQASVGFTNEFKSKFEGMSSKVVCLECMTPGASCSVQCASQM